MFDKPAATAVPVSPLIRRRWSGRAYDRERPVARENLLALLEAARWAPSCFGDQPWRYLICDRHVDAGAWQSLLECLSDGNRAWAGDAPVLMLALADSRFVHNDQPNRWGAYDTGAASMSICIQATDIGLMVHQMGGFDVDRARENLAVPERYVPMAAIAVGYQLPEARIPEPAREREFATRTRRPVRETFFEGRWGIPLSMPPGVTSS
jgi:nitroreductase